MQSQTKEELEHKLVELKSYLLAQPLNMTLKELVRQQEILLKNIHTATPTTIPTTMPTDKKKKKTIPSTIKKLVWNTNIGEYIGKTKCTCCKSTDITQMSFNCGHIIAEANGGKTIVSNLKPICQNCNSSMGTKNMNEFMLSLK